MGEMQWTRFGLAESVAQITTLSCQQIGCWDVVLLFVFLVDFPLG